MLFGLVFAHAFHTIDEQARGRIVRGYFFVIIKFGQYTVGKCFAKLHTPLVRAENIPNNSLNKNTVFKKGNECT